MRARSLLVEIAWYWLRYQPHSALSQWVRSALWRRGERMRRIGIVALARRLLVALWRYLEHGLIPLRARLKRHGLPRARPARRDASGVELTGKKQYRADSSAACKEVQVPVPYPGEHGSTPSLRDGALWCKGLATRHTAHAA